MFPFDLLELRAAICRAAPEWGGIGVSASTKYLGLMVGPGKGASSWTAPIRKYQQRAALWGHAGLGMHLSLRAYRIYMLSVLMLVGQLEDPPSTFDAVELAACRKLFSGPAHWITHGVLQNLKALWAPSRIADAFERCTGC